MHEYEPVCLHLPLPRIRTRAILCHIYHHALHNRWYQARDLMMMSHLQESINLADVVTQVHMYMHTCTVHVREEGSDCRGEREGESE